MSDIDDTPLRQAIGERAASKRRNFAAWIAGQGAKIKAARPLPVYNACVLAASRLAGQRHSIILTVEQIKICEDRALSAARVSMFGPLPRTNEEWQAQLEQVRAGWNASVQAAA